MKRVLNIAEQIRQLLLKNTIMSLKQLRSELQDRPRSSLFRDLKKLDLISSYTHTGQYHALTRFAKRNVSMKMRHRLIEISVATQPPARLLSRRLAD